MRVQGDANDYCGKGLSGASFPFSPPRMCLFRSFLFGFAPFFWSQAARFTSPPPPICCCRIHSMQRNRYHMHRNFLVSHADNLFWFHIADNLFLFHRLLWATSLCIAPLPAKRCSAAGLANDSACAILEQWQVIKLHVPTSIQIAQTQASTATLDRVKQGKTPGATHK